MKKKLLSILLAALLLLALPIPAMAAESRTFYPTFCEWDGQPGKTTGEYVVLNDDGTGMVVVNYGAYRLTWTDADGQFTFTDHIGNEFVGAMESDSVLKGVYRRYTFVYELGEDAPVTSLSPETWGRGLSCVTDQADILLDSEEEALSARAAQISEKYGCNVYIVTLDDLRHFSLATSVELCAEEIRTGYDLGSGSDRDCIMLLLSMAERDYDLVAFGQFGNASFTDYGKDYVVKRFLDDFRDNDWYSGFSDYLTACDKLLDLSSKGTPLDVGSRPANKGLAAALSLAVSFLVAFLICSGLKGSMKATKVQTTAENYIPDGGAVIDYRYDQYTHSTETRVYDPPKSSGGRGGGGGTSISSSGHSHSSGKF